jgi:hypothetical protein
MLGSLEWRWLWGIYSSQPPIQSLGQAAVDGRTEQSGAPATSPNRVLTVGALSSSGIRHALFTVRCAFLRLL